MKIIKQTYKKTKLPKKNFQKAGIKLNNKKKPISELDIKMNLAAKKKSTKSLMNLNMT